MEMLDKYINWYKSKVPKPLKYISLIFHKLIGVLYDSGRREEKNSPPRGIVKNLRGMFENPQGFEARTG